MNHQNSQQLTIQQAISRAKKAIKQGNTAVALELYNAVLQQQPNHPIAKKRLNKLQKELSNDRSAQAQTTQPSQVQIDALVNLYQTGQMAKVELACGKLLKSHPHSLEVINILGAANYAQNKLEEAIAAYNKALLIKPDYAAAYSNRGLALKQLGQLDEAIASFDKAIQLKPDSAAAYSNRGITLKQLGRLEEAMQSYDKAIQFKPDYAEAYSNRGNALQVLGRLNESIQNHDKAIQLKPDYAEAYSNRGNALQVLGRLNESIQNHNKAIQLKPDYVEAYNNRGNALKDLWQLEEAIQNYDKAIQLKPDLAEAYCNRGITLKQLGRLEEAMQSYDRAIQFKPDYAEAYSNRGNALQVLGRLNESIQNHNKAIQLKPDFPRAHSNRGVTLKDLGLLEEAMQSYDKAIQLKPDYAEAYSNLLMSLNYIPNHNAIDHIAMARKFGELVTEKAKPHSPDYQCLPTPEKLRVGLVSSDLRNHPIGYFLESVLSSMDPSKIELIAYPTTPVVDDLTERIKPSFSMWKPIYDQTDEAAANMIYADGVHILLDLSGHTAGNRLSMFGYKPSPVQVSWLGYFATTGLNEMDYLIGDPYVTPPEDDDQFTERVWRLPETRWCFTPPDVDIEVSVPPAVNHGYVTFGCFNNITKVNDKVVALWTKVLEAVPNSRLLLKAKQFRDQITRESIIQRFAAHGIDSKRISLEEQEDRQKYFAAYNKIDITLDPFPFTGERQVLKVYGWGFP